MSSEGENLATGIEKITLKTADDILFEVDKPVAMELDTVKNFFCEDESNIASSSEAGVVVPLLNVSAQALEKIIIYCTKQVEFDKRPADIDNEEKNKMKKFRDEFVNELGNEELKELIVAANYLNIPSLMDTLCDNAADRIKNRSVKYVRKFFGIENDYTPEEEQALREQYAWAFEGVEED
ncbi:SKP1-like protein 16 [Linum grandiflorum]